MAVSFDQLMQGFGVVTVMDACLYKLAANKTYVGRGACHHGETNSGALTPDDFECSGLYLDTLKIANFTQEGPTKTITGGQYANPIIKYGIIYIPNLTIPSTFTKYKATKRATDTTILINIFFCFLFINIHLFSYYK